MSDRPTNAQWPSWLTRTVAHYLPARVPPASPSPRFSRGEGRGEGRLQLREGRLQAPPHTKSYPAPYFAFDRLGAPTWGPRDYSAFAREGYMANAILYRSVRMIAEAAASVPLLLYSGDDEIAAHPLIDLLARPSRTVSTPDFLESWYGFLLISGNAYIEAVAVGSSIRELHPLRPDRMKVVPGANGWPEAFEYTVDGKARRLRQEVIPGVSSILHVKLFHPANDHYGLSPIEAAASAVDIHNTASRWNKALLDNSARPSGALVYTARDGNLTVEQYDRLKSELEQGFQGAARAGRPLLLEGGLDWKSMSMSPKDMDFIEAKHVAAREIALAVGVPPMLLGIPGDNTYSNYQEATRSFWRATVLPLVTRTAKALSAWLGPAYGGVRPSGSDTLAPPEPHLELRPDLDTIEALSTEREALWSRLEKATFLTPNEKRTALGYAPIAGGDEIKCDANHLGTAVNPKANFNPGQLRDETGRWTGEGGGDGIVHDVSRRRGGRREGTPGQQARLAVATSRARDAERRLRELDPDWRGPRSFTSPEGIEGRIAHQEATARGAEARLAEILRDAIPNANPSWGVNRLRRELSSEGYILSRPATRGDSRGIILENSQTQDQVRVMERPMREPFRTESRQKFHNRYYYRYKPANGSWGSHITIPDR